MTFRRRARRHRALARHRWFLHKANIKPLDARALAGIYQHLSTHHSKDVRFLSAIRRSIAIAMAHQDQLFPWRCQCGSLNAKRAVHRPPMQLSRGHRVQARIDSSAGTSKPRGKPKAGSRRWKPESRGNGSNPPAANPPGIARVPTEQSQTRARARESRKVVWCPRCLRTTRRSSSSRDRPLCYPPIKKHPG